MMSREEWKNHVALDHMEEVLYYVECLMGDYSTDRRTDIDYEDLEDIHDLINLLMVDLNKRIKGEQ